MSKSKVDCDRGSGTLWILVRFTEDNAEYVVTADDVQDFNVKHSISKKLSSKVYKVRWQTPSDSFDGCYDAKIICISESLHELAKKAADMDVKKMPRNYFTLLKDMESAGELDEVEQPQTVGAKKKSARKFRLADGESHSHSDGSLKHTYRKKLDPSSESGKHKRPRMSSATKEGSALIGAASVDPPASQLKEEENSLKLQIMQKEQELLMLRAKCSAETLKSSAGEGTPQEETQLDVNKHEYSKPSGLSRKAHSSRRNQIVLPDGCEDRAVIAQKVLDDFQNKKPLPLVNDGKDVDLGNDVTVNKETWGTLKNVEKETLFIKKLAQAHYGQKGLATRTVGEPTGTKSSKTVATPKKMETFLGAFRAYNMVKYSYESPHPNQVAKWDKEGVTIISQKMQDEARNRGKKKN